MTVALVGSAAYVGVVATGAADPAGDSALDVIVFLIGFVGTAALSLALGLLTGRLASLIGLVALIGAAEWRAPDPFPVVVAVGFWLVGAAIRSHRSLDLALRTRAYEVAVSRELFVAEAVRYERIRIARELHDVIAHGLSVIVIQASAGQRLPANDPGADELFETIRVLTGQAREDLSGLAELIDRSVAEGPALTRTSLDDLVQRTAATGSPVACPVPDGIDDIPAGVGAIAYRVVQEGLTNAIKHAPGAAIDVSIASAPSVAVAVVNQAGRPAWSSRPVPGAGRGLAGLAERVVAAGGTLDSGPTSQGGWRLAVRLPL